MSPSRRRHAGLTLLLLLLAMSSVAEARRLRVCELVFNSREEIGVIESHLPASEFEIIDLSPRWAAHWGQPGTTAVTTASDMDGAPPAWLSNLCRQDIECDVVVYTGEFAGRFFGTSGTSLSLAQLEEASCRPQCDGLFHRPQEVFLLGCNTLATKDEDSRTPQEYLDVLLDHGFDQASAERAVQLRYGPVGPSMRSSFRRIFMGVPRIYGFSSVAPSAAHDAPLLEAYFRAQGDYARHLRAAEGDTRVNERLRAAYGDTSLTQAPGLMASENGAEDRTLACTLYDESESVAERLRIIQRIMERGDFLAFVPAVQVFLIRHPPESFTVHERRAFTQVQAEENARAEVLGLIQALDASALKLEMAQLAIHLGWMTQPQFRRLAVNAARDLLRRAPVSQVVDVMCEITKDEAIGGEFVSDDVPGRWFQDAEGIRLVDCLSPQDPRISARLVDGLDSPEPMTRLWAGYALSKRLPLDDGVLERVATHLRDDSPDVRERLRWILQAQSPLSERVLRAVARHDLRFAQYLYHRAAGTP